MFYHVVPVNRICVILSCLEIDVGKSQEIAFSMTIQMECQVRSGDQDYSCSMLLYHVISTNCSHAGGWGSAALAGHSSRGMLVFTPN